MRAPAKFTSPSTDKKSPCLRVAAKAPLPRTGSKPAQAMNSAFMIQIALACSTKSVLLLRQNKRKVSRQFRFAMNFAFSASQLATLPVAEEIKR